MGATRAKYELGLWLPRALAFARALKGRPRTKEEAEFAMLVSRDLWDYTRAFGIQHETQAYIDRTADMIQDMIDDGVMDLGKEIVLRLRLKWSAIATKEKEAI